MLTIVEKLELQPPRLQQKSFFSPLIQHQIVKELKIPGSV